MARRIANDNATSKCKADAKAHPSSWRISAGFRLIRPKYLNQDDIEVGCEQEAWFMNRTPTCRQ